MSASLWTAAMVAMSGTAGANSEQYGSPAPLQERVVEVGSEVLQAARQPTAVDAATSVCMTSSVPWRGQLVTDSVKCRHPHD
jgi:hypothetical protein